MFKKLTACRVCKKRNLKNFLSLGEMILVNNFLTAYQLSEPEFRFPLSVNFCPNCNMVQLGEIINPEVLYRNYVYISSYSKMVLDHFQKLASLLVQKFGLTDNSLVVEIGSNDGTLLKFFKDHKVRILGIDPAENLAEIANKNDLETWPDFFNEKTARKIVREKGNAQLLVGNNVFAHIDDLDDLLRALNVALADDGIFIAEFPYLLDLISGNQFDTIYHEHLSYFSVKPLIYLFQRFGLELFDVDRISVHGGSIRIYVGKKGEHKINTNKLEALLSLEKKAHFDKFSTYIQFAKRVKQIKKDLNSLLKKLKKQKKKIIGFGAPAKGNILLNYCKTGGNYLDYITDNISYKQGLYTPGTHLQVFPEIKLYEDKPDYLLLLPWNCKEEILGKLRSYRKSGGKIIVPIPKVEVV